MLSAMRLSFGLDCAWASGFDSITKLAKMIAQRFNGFGFMFCIFLFG